MAKEAKVKQEAIELHAKLDLPTTWVDNMIMAFREDDVCLLRFATQLPEGHFEQTRILTSKVHLQRMIDVMCSTLNYYPTKTKTPKK